MKKAWIFLIVLAVLAFSVPAFADGPTLKFSMPAYWWANYDPTVNAAGANGWVASGMQRVWPTADIAFDENNTLEIGLRLPGITGLTTVRRTGHRKHDYCTNNAPSVPSRATPTFGAMDPSLATSGECRTLCGTSCGPAT